MKKIRLFVLCALGLLEANPLKTNFLYGQTSLYSQSQVLQRNHLVQMRFPSIYAWRAWGMANLDLKKNFITQQDSVVGFLPQIGLDREYPLASSSIPSSLMIGVDIDGSVGDLQSGGEKLSGGGYAIGGYAMWKSEDGYFASFATKYIQTFQKVLEKDFRNSMWAFDFGGGKRFDLGEGYFVDASANFGVGAILDSSVEIVYENQNLTQSMEPITPYNIMLSAFIGRKIGDNEVRVGFSPMGEIYVGGKEVITTPNGIINVANPSLSRFNILLSIAYNMRFTERVDFYTYADFHALEFHGKLGIGVRVGFGENVYSPLKFPTIKLDKLKKTYLK